MSESEIRSLELKFSFVLRRDTKTIPNSTLYYIRDLSMLQRSRLVAPSRRAVVQTYLSAFVVWTSFRKLMLPSFIWYVGRPERSFLEGVPKYLVSGPYLPFILFLSYFYHLPAGPWRRKQHSDGTIAPFPANKGVLESPRPPYRIVKAVPGWRVMVVVRLFPF